MASRSRRGVAALTSAVSLAAGIVAATATGAQAAGTADPAAGQIALNVGTSVQLVNPDGSGARTVAGITDAGHLAPNWAPDGSRLLAGDGGWSLATAKVSGNASRVTLPAPDTDVSGTGYHNAVFWLDGTYVVSGTGEELMYGPSDGSYGSQPLLPVSQRPSSACDDEPTAAPNGIIAFTRADPCGTSAGPGVWEYDPKTSTAKRIVVSGEHPAFAADGSALAYTSSVDGRQQIFTAAPDGTGAKQVTTDAADHQDLSWDPAGGRIAYDSVDPATGAVTAKIVSLADGTQTTLSTTGSKPAWQPLRHNILDRVYGTGSIGIDGAASRWTFDTLGATHVPGLLPAKSAVLVSKSFSTYAAPAVSLAAEKQGPVVLTSTGGLDSSAVTELKRSLPKGSTVYLVGNTKVLSSKVASQVQALGYTALRMDGADLGTVGARIARQITQKPSWIFVADLNDYHDPVAAASAAGALGYRGTGVVLLSRGTTLPSATQAYLNALNPATTNLVSVGTNARKALENTPLKNSWNFWDVSGSTTEVTAVNLARFWWASPNNAVVEDTWNWQYAITGQAVTATYGPMLWSTVIDLSPQSAAYLTSESASIQYVQTFGGNDAYTPANRTSIGTAIAASSSWTTTVWIAGGTPPASATALAPATTFASPRSSGPTAAPSGPRPAAPHVAPAPRGSAHFTR
ncbi:cell wall-binding repeat-containing protein [Actinacidiphila acididurans]|uniref:PD40 domain-containing protein n=1 Tax=Actinacidiphila acididurans TaxID=2784346 RepID=A0ABS2U3M2_9ACTN|nr:cell wall-binding repeat-containing protein [Actinacidiphila acididurans]MBM9510210.1 PD40 domain-containing protein [Actinacidiphila acididurans]